MKLISAFTLLIALSSGAVCFAQELDAASKEALAKTQQLLTTPAEREAAISKSPGGQIADGQIKALAGTQANTDEIYKITSDIFASMVAETGGDPVKMQALMDKAKNDPKGFADHMNAKDRKAIEDVSHKISVAPNVRQPAGSQ